MANYNYLKIDFFGQFNADTVHQLTYPEAFNPSNSAANIWLLPIKDPRSLMRITFPAAPYGYAIHRDGNGTYYSLLCKYDKDAREGYVSVTVMIGAQYESMIKGAQILRLLNTLKLNVVDTQRFTPTDVERCLALCQMPQTQAQPMRIVQQPQMRGGQAFRVYSSNEELAEYFSFPNQNDYRTYSEVFFIDSRWAPASSTVQRLTTPFIKTYQVVKPAGVNVDGIAQTQRQINITYSKPGFAPITVPVTIDGRDNQYLHYQGSTVTVLQPANLPFKQNVRLNVTINGRSYPTGVNAMVGNVPLTQSNGAYQTQVSPEQLGGDILIKVDVRDNTLVNRYEHSASRETRVEYEEASVWSSWKTWAAIITSFLIGAVAMGAVYWFILRDNNIKKPGETETTKTEETTEEFAKSFDQSDLEYMKVANQWDRTNITGEKGQQLFDALRDADKGKFMNLAQEYINSDKHNGFIERIYNALRDDPGLESKFIQACSEQTHGNIINIDKIASVVAPASGNKAVAPANTSADQPINRQAPTPSGQPTRQPNVGNSDIGHAPGNPQANGGQRPERTPQTATPGREQNNRDNNAAQQNQQQQPKQPKQQQQQQPNEIKQHTEADR